MGFGPLQQFLQRRIVQPPQHQHLGAGQKRPVQFEGRIFGGGAHQDDGSVLHHRQKGILLAAVEAVDFVDEQQRALPGLAARPRGLERLFQVGNAGEHRRQLLEMQFEGGRQQPGDGGFAGPRRTPQNDGMRPPRRHHAPDRAVGGQQMILAHHFGQAFGPQPVGQGSGRVVGPGRRIRTDQTFPEASRAPRPTPGVRRPTPDRPGRLRRHISRVPTRSACGCPAGSPDSIDWPRPARA